MNRIRVIAPARLHLGMFDPGGTLGRRFGGIGVALRRPQVVLEAQTGQILTVDGPGADRVRLFAQRYLEAYGIRTGAHLSIEENIPSHVGLGSGTKLALAVAHAVQCPYCIDAYTNTCLEKGSNKAEMTEAIHVACAIRGGASLVHGVQMRNICQKISL